MINVDIPHLELKLETYVTQRPFDQITITLQPLNMTDEDDEY